MQKKENKQDEGTTYLLLEEIRKTGILTQEEMKKVEGEEPRLIILAAQLFEYNVQLAGREDMGGVDHTKSEVAKDLAVAAIGSSFPHGFLNLVNKLTSECLNNRGFAHIT